MTKIKKDIINTLIERELSLLDEICEVLEELKIVRVQEWKGYLSESDVRCWYEANPSLDEKKKVLTTLGYDVEKL